VIDVIGQASSGRFPSRYEFTSALQTVEWISPEGARAPQVLSSFSHPTSRMSDLGLLVAAALRDKVVEDLLSENRRLRREIEELQDRLYSSIQLTLQSPNRDESVVYARIHPRGHVEHVQPLRTLGELLAAHLWLGPNWLRLDSVGRLSVDSILYERRVAEADVPIQRGQHEDPALTSTRVRVDTQWLSVRFVVPWSLLDVETMQYLYMSMGHETVEQVLRSIGGRPVHAIEILSHGIPIPSSIASARQEEGV